MLIPTENSNSVKENPTDMDSDLRVPLSNLSNVRLRMDSLQQFLTESVNANTLISKHQMDMVSSEISTAIQQIIVNGAALLACAQTLNPNEPVPNSNPEIRAAPATATATVELKVDEHDRDEVDADCEIVELDAVELLAEHIHFCEICGKGFKRDANLRMHMRAHGNRFKTPEALAKPEKMKESESKTKKMTRFSCPYEGCNRNKRHKKFRPLKSVICVRNHFKRSHCPKMYSCNRCHKKSFSVVADLKSHMKHCGESKWKCSCGTSFSRKDKLFGHMALFEGHMPAVVEDDKDVAEETVDMEDDDVLFDGLGFVEDFSLQDVLGSNNELE
jgi:hypothetical protein